ncbi:septum formation family protein [Streptomyces sp. NPDC060030]|uniref:septum formation family protein n=1 Tax=Streptomyces sp. NPDC060030 TaxID=3347042 RepID=UPI0036CD3693
MGVRLGPGNSPARTRIAVDPDAVRLRAGEAGYWLTYEGTLETFGGEASISALRGSESAFGGTLLEILSGAQDVKGTKATEGGRTYKAKLTAYNALRMFSQDMRAELTSNIDPSGTDTPVTLSIVADAEGHITRAEADFSGLLERKDSALADMTGLHAVMTLSGQGDSPPVMPTPSEPTLDAKTAVRPVGDQKEGTCADLATGNRMLDMVVDVPCTQPHDVRVFAHATLGTEYPGDANAQRQAGEACRREHRSAPGTWKREAADEDVYWYTWPEEDRWGVGGAATVSCYIVTRDPVTTRALAV